jgi:large subunit ribosomal protein L21
MYAIVKTGGKQYRVAPGDVIRVEKLSAAAGSLIELDQVLLLGGADAGVQIGTPRIEGAAVSAAVLEQMRDDTVLVFKKKRRHNYRRKRGHRQHLTVLRIAEILPPGAKRTVTLADLKPARPKKHPALAAEAAHGDAKRAEKKAAKKAASEKAETKKAEAKAPAKKAKAAAPAKSAGKRAAKSGAKDKSGSKAKK